MSRRTLLFVLAPALLVGCVPVAEPLGDVDKAEPDKRLIGTWQMTGAQDYEIDVPAVKGNPKGLMRAVGNRMPDEPANSFWFHLTAIGKHTYATIYLDQEADGKFADFRSEGAFAKWQKGTNRRYFVFRYTLDGDRLTVDGGNDKAVEKLMADERIEKAGSYFKTPVGWLAKFLDKHAGDAIFDGSNVERRTSATK